MVTNITTIISTTLAITTILLPMSNYQCPRRTLSLSLSLSLVLSKKSANLRMMLFQQLSPDSSLSSNPEYSVSTVQRLRKREDDGPALGPSVGPHIAGKSTICVKFVKGFLCSGLNWSEGKWWSKMDGEGRQWGGSVEYGLYYAFCTR